MSAPTYQKLVDQSHRIALWVVPRSTLKHIHFSAELCRLRVCFFIAVDPQEENAQDQNNCAQDPPHRPFLEDRDFRTYTIDRVSEVDPKEIDRLLYPLLKADDRPKSAAMLAGTTPPLASVLDHSREEGYLASMATGKYQPELLFPKHPAVVERIRLHPALLWKAQHVAQYRGQSKKPS